MSRFFPVPSYQSSIRPVSANPAHLSGRGVPDVAGNASPTTGYETLVHGQSGPIGGTSAVAPLWSALLARIQQQLGRSAAPLLPAIYALPNGFPGYHCRQQRGLPSRTRLGRLYWPWKPERIRSCVRAGGRIFEPSLPTPHQRVSEWLGYPANVAPGRSIPEAQHHWISKRGGHTMMQQAPAHVRARRAAVMRARRAAVMRARRAAVMRARRAPPSCGHAAPPSCGHAAPPSCGHAAPPSCGHAAPPSCGHAAPPSCGHAARRRHAGTPRRRHAGTPRRLVLRSRSRRRDRLRPGLGLRRGARPAAEIRQMSRHPGDATPTHPVPELARRANRFRVMRTNDFLSSATPSAR